MASDLFVSRGGEKLQAAIDQFKIEVKDKTVLDVGSSTGGFVDCLLQNGAAKVYALDTAYGELAWKLRNDPRVVVMERTNILHLQTLAEQLDLVTIDAGWTKLELVLPVIRNFLKKDGFIIALLKPHYEAQPLTRFARYEGGQKSLVKGVVPIELLEQIKNETINKIEDLGFKIQKVIPSPILGGAGNKEFLLYLKY